MRSKSRNSGFRLYGILGSPLSHTLSPVMQEAGFRAQGLAAFYVPLEMEPSKVVKFLAGIKKQCLLSGFNVTVPFKEAALKWVDVVSPEARAIGAVNTVLRREKKWYGANTDAYGFLASLPGKIRRCLRGKKALILGAGGGSKAVIFALASSGVGQITIVNRTIGRAKKIAGEFQKKFTKTKFKIVSLDLWDAKPWVEEADLMINTTSVGLRSQDEELIPKRAIPSAKAVGRKFFMDLIYRPAETPLLKSARQQGHDTLNGLGMLLHQGGRSFEIWTNRKAPVRAMRQALQTALQG